MLDKQMGGSGLDRVAYKPLELASAGEEYLDDHLEPDGEAEDPPFSLKHQYKSHPSILLTTLSYLSLRQLRVLLFVVAMLLLILFIAQLAAFKGGAEFLEVRHNLEISSRKYTQQPRIQNPEPYLKDLNAPSDSISAIPLPIKMDDRPPYDSYLTSVLHEANIRSTREYFDDLRLPTEDQQTNSSQSASTIWWVLNLRDSNKYVTVTNYIRAMKSFNYNSSITLTTQATTEFMFHTLELCKRWDGPISVAVFTPGVEMLVATTLIKFMRQCLPVPLSACIRDKVTWHLVYNKSHGPPASAISYPRFHLDSKNYPLFVHQDQCPKLAGPEPSDLIKQFEVELRKSNKIYPDSYRQEFQLPYPINVLRNTARLAAGTNYVLASDIELYPSINLVPSFTNYIIRHNITEDYKYIKKYGFTLPIFEVSANVTAPKTKDELLKLVQQGDAIFFHKWVCDWCQNFPNRLDWLQTDKYGLDNFRSDGDEIVIFEITQRNSSRDSWEPIFIGTNDDPLYDDRLTWEGRRDKMGQMYEMCLQDYYMLVLGNAFLVHAPGIKHIDRNDNMKRSKYMRENNAIYDTSLAELKKRYSGSANINKC